MEFPFFRILFAACGVLAVDVLPLAAPAADRNIDTNVVYPAAALVQNGGRILNVRTPPAGLTAALGHGTTDDTAAFQDAYDYIKTKFLASASNSYVIYVPNGTYRVTSTLIYRGTTDAAMTTVSVQTSPDLLAWMTLTNPGPAQTGTDPDTGDSIFQVRIPVSSGKQFARLNVSQP